MYQQSEAPVIQKVYSECITFIQFINYQAGLIY